MRIVDPVGSVVSTTTLSSELSVVSASTLDWGSSIVSATALSVVTAATLLRHIAGWGVVSASSHGYLESDDGKKMHEEINCEMGWVGWTELVVGDLLVKVLCGRTGDSEQERLSKRNQDLTDRKGCEGAGEED